MKKLVFGIFVLLGVLHSNAQEQESTTNKWQARFRILSVIPDESASIEAIGGDVDISTAFVPEVDFTYFFSKNWAMELILATTKHDVEAVSTAVGDIDLGSVWLLPPTLSLQYHYPAGKFKPYAGVGLNYTIFYGADEGPIANEVSYEDTFGLSLQAGIDYMLTDKWFLNFDIKKLFLQTEATVNATSALGATVKADVDINPWIVGIGAGIKF
ncbi:OmpW/AlkL family protein [Aquimarina rhabdastrellae]